MGTTARTVVLGPPELMKIACVVQGQTCCSQHVVCVCVSWPRRTGSRVGQSVCQFLSFGFFFLGLSTFGEVSFKSRTLMEGRTSFGKLGGHFGSSPGNVLKPVWTLFLQRLSGFRQFTVRARLSLVNDISRLNRVSDRNHMVGFLCLVL